MEMINLEWRKIRKGVYGWIATYSLSILMFIAFFPSMQTDSMQSLAFAKMESMSTVVLSIFGLDTIPDFTRINNYYGYVAQFMNMAACIFSATLGLNMLIREETEGTIEYLYAKPITRKEIFWQKSLTNFFGFLLFVLISSLVIFSGFVFFAKETASAALGLTVFFAKGTFFAGLVFMSIGILLSTIISSSRISSTVAFALVFGTYSLGIMSSLIKKLNFLKYLSPLDWVKYSFTGGPTFTTLTWGIGIAVIVISLIIGMLIYQNKDFQS
jgi:ABC-2 type transport system permease protein